MQDEIREIGSKSAVVFVGRILGKTLELLSIVIIGYFLGASTYGSYVFMISFLAFFTIIPKFGMDTGIVSFLSRGHIDQSDKKSLATFSLVLSSLLSLFFILLLYLFKDFFYKIFVPTSVDMNLFVVLIPSIYFFTLNQIIVSILRGYKKVVEKVILVDLVSPIIKLCSIAIIVLVFKISDYSVLVFSYYLSSGIVFILLVLRLKHLDLIRLGVKNSINKKLIQYSMPLLFANSIMIINTNIDKYMIGVLLTNADVGVYKLAMQFSLILSLALVSANSIMSPIISSLYHDNKLVKLKHIYKTITKWIVVFNLTVFGGMVVFASDLVALLGAEWTLASKVLIIACLGQIVNSFVGAVTIINNMTGNQKKVLISSSITLLINIILNIILIPMFGIIGAAFATSISIAFRNIMNFIFMYKKFKIHPYDKSYFKIITIITLATAFTFLMYQITNIDLLLKYILFGSLYLFVVGLFMFKFALTKEEIEYIKNIRK